MLCPKYFFAVCLWKYAGFVQNQAVVSTGIVIAEMRDQIVVWEYPYSSPVDFPFQLCNLSTSACEHIYE